MVWHVQANAIVMVTLLAEQGKKKCEMYWPDKTGVPTMYGDVRVTLTSAKRFKGYIVSLLSVECGGEVRNLSHFWFVGWNDHGVPRGDDGDMHADDLIGRPGLMNRERERERE